MIVSLLLLLILLFTPTVSANSLSDDARGLYMYSYNVDPQNRTSVAINGGELIAIVPESKLSFKMFARSDFGYGSIVNISTNSNTQINLTRRQGNMVDVKVGGVSKQFMLPVESWTEISLYFCKGAIEVSVGEQQLTYEVNTKDFKSIRVTFGGYINIDSEVAINEVAAFNLKDLSITKAGKIQNGWSFERLDADNIVYDSVAKMPAKVTNARLLSDDYYYWRHELQRTDSGEIAATFSDRFSQIYIFSSSGKYNIYDLLNWSNPTEREFSGDELNVVGGLFAVLNSDADSLTVYNSLFNQASTLDLNSDKWVDRAEKRRITMAHAAYYYDQERGVIYSFGGYARHRYSNTLSIYNINSKEVQQVTLGLITPRCQTAMCLVGDKIYIFGGRGSLDGSQEPIFTSYLDLYEVDLVSFETRQLWSTEPCLNYDFFSPTMIYDEELDMFWAFSNGNIVGFNKELPKVELYGEKLKLPYEKSSYVQSQIFLSKSLNELYLLTEMQHKDSPSEVLIHSLKYPPLSREYVMMSSGSKGDSKGVNWLIISIVTTTLLLICGVAIFLTKRSSKRRFVAKVDRVQPAVVAGKTTPLNHLLEGRCRIHLLGEFSIFDAAGNNVTGQIQPAIIRLLVVLLVESVQSKDGTISTKHLDRLLWSDKYGNSAVNNRNVSLSRLRIFLSTLDAECTITNVNRQISINIPDAIFCDLWYIYKFFERAAAAELIDYTSEEFANLLSILKRGVALSDEQDSVVDDYKSNVTSLIVDNLIAVMRIAYEAKHEVVLDIADVILINESLNEEAMQIKCKVYNEMGQKQRSKQIYDNFCKQYKELIGEEYKVGFLQF